jgi:hypothetical protein
MIAKVVIDPTFIRSLPRRPSMIKMDLVNTPFVLFYLAIMLSVLRFTDSDYLFGIFNLFLNKIKATPYRLITIVMIFTLNCPPVSVVIVVKHELFSNK